MLTPEQIAAIEAREQAATAGPWTEWEGDLVIGCDCDPSDECDCPPIHGVGIARDGVAPLLVTTGYDLTPTDENLAFIAHAREDIPALLADRRELVAEVARLRAVVEKLERRLDAWAEADGEEDEYGA